MEELAADQRDTGGEPVSVNERIITALAPLGLSVTPDTHRPEQGDTYVTFGYDTSGDNFGDNVPQVEVYACMIHLWAPSGRNMLEVRRSIRKLLAASGFTWPREIDAGDEDGQHFVYECEMGQWVGGGAVWQG